MNTTHTTGGHSRGGSHLSQEKNTKAMHKEIDRLKRELRHERRWRSPTVFYFSSNDKDDGNYRQRSTTPPSESFLHVKEYRRDHRDRHSSIKGLGNDALSKALKQISKSPFTCRIEEGRLPSQFTQRFTLYNGRTDPVEHVSHFNQKMAVNSKNEPLMCKVFLSSLGHVAIRWFDSLRADSISSFEELT